MTTGTLTRKTDPHQKCLSSHPADDRADPIPMPDTPAQIPIARATFLRLGEDVGEDRERRRHDEALAPTPMSARVHDQLRGESRTRQRTDPTPKITQPDA